MHPIIEICGRKNELSSTRNFLISRFPIMRNYHSQTAIIPAPCFALAPCDARRESILELAPAFDAVAMLLADKRSAATRRAYASDLALYFGADASPGAVRAFLAQPTRDIALQLTTYKARLMASGAAEATINRRLAALKSLLKMANRAGYCQTDGRGLVDSERVTAYRDTRGIELKQMRRLLKLPAKLHGADTVRGLRDVALLRLLCENALRRAEVCALTVGDFEPAARRIFILGKGKGTQRAPVTLSGATVEAIEAYLSATGRGDGNAADEAGPLFLNLTHDATRRGALMPDGLHHLIGEYGRALGLKRLSPHQLRHSSITAALDATGGDVRSVQRLSRHAQLQTLQLYDDARRDAQGEVTNKLAALWK
jgi:integrase/recombinase XerC